MWPLAKLPLYQENEDLVGFLTFWKIIILLRSFVLNEVRHTVLFCCCLSPGGLKGRLAIGSLSEHCTWQSGCKGQIEKYIYWFWWKWPLWTAAKRAAEGLWKVTMTIARNNTGCIFPIITIMKRFSAVKLVFFLFPLTRWDWKLLNCFGWIYYKAKIGMHLRTEKSMAGEAGTFYICFKWTIWLEHQLRLFIHVKNIGQVKRENSLLIVHEELAP